MAIKRLIVPSLFFCFLFVSLSGKPVNAGTTSVGGVTVIVDKFQTRFTQLDGTTTIPFKRIHGTIFNLNNFDIQIDSVTLNYYSGSTLLGSVVNGSSYINWIYGTDFIPNASRIPARSQASLGLYPSVSSSIWQNATDVKVSLSWHQISYDENRNFELTVLSTGTSVESRGGTNTIFQTHVVRVKNLNSGSARQPEIVGIYRASSNYYGLFSAIGYFDTFNYFKNLGGWTDTEHLMTAGETRELVLKRQVGLDEPEIPTNVTFIAESITPLATANPVIVKPVKAIATVKPTVTGTAKVSKTLTAKKGTWTGYPTPTVSYQWYACSSSISTPRSTVPTSCKKISGATKSTFKIASSQKGKFISVLVTGVSTGTSKTTWLSKSTLKVK